MFGPNPKSNRLSKSCFKILNRAIRRYPYYFTLFAAACVHLFIGCSSHAESDVQVSSTKVIKAPDFELTDLQGKKVSLKSLKGKVVFLDFWATWCPPCVISAPEVEKLVQDYKGKNFEVLSISLDSSETPVKRYLTTHKVTSRVMLAGESGVDGRYSVQGIPAYFIVDQNGNVAKAWEGYNPTMTKLWRKEIDRLLGI